MTFNHILKIAAFVLAFGGISSVSASDRDRTGQFDMLSLLTTPERGTSSHMMGGASFQSGTIFEAIQDQLNQLIGTPYRYGGNSSKVGFDCSGLVVHVFSKLGLPELPRSSFGMAQKGVRIEPGELQFGDLVFFNTRGRMYSHVGIYTGNGRFVHAATMNRRVMESSLSEPYYRARFNGARRVIGTL